MVQRDSKEGKNPIAYFSMEVGLRDDIPTYSGGLGVLAGDSLKSLADLGVIAVGVTLLSEKGYFYQTFNDDNYQQEQPSTWKPENLLTKINKTVTIHLKDREVQVTAWRYDIIGESGHKVPLYFLDTNLEQNAVEDRKLTSFLYGGDKTYRLEQEIVLGVAGAKFLHALDYQPRKYHLNEGHAAFLITQLATVYQGSQEKIQDMCSFTTHTPVPAGHDSFDKETLFSYFSDKHDQQLLLRGCQDNTFNMTRFALSYSSYANSVSHKHQLVSKKLFPHFPTDYITNGVHSTTWVSQHLASLFDKYIFDWRKNPLQLRNALSINDDELWSAHQKAKTELVDFINTTYNAGFQHEIFTIGFARRATSYKRAELLFSNKDVLQQLAHKHGKIQLVFAGKAHPRDIEGKKIIQRLRKIQQEFQGSVVMVFLDNYTLFTAKLLVAGVDLWLNTPQRPLEASGTSGMKAAHNGVPSLSVLDGWWLEGCLEGITGWGIAGSSSQSLQEQNDKDGAALYRILSEKIIPLYYSNTKKYISIMKHAIAINASYFNTHRMIKQYIVRAYARKQ